MRGRDRLAKGKGGGAWLVFIKKTVHPPLLNTLDLGYIHLINLASFHWAIHRALIGPFIEFSLGRLSSSYWAAYRILIGHSNLAHIH